MLILQFPGDKNVIKKETEKILEYKDLTTQIQRMWNLKAKVIPVVMGGDWDHFKITLTIPEQHTVGKHEIKNLQRQPYWALHTYCGKC